MTGVLANEPTAPTSDETQPGFDGPFWWTSKGASLNAFVIDGGSNNCTHGPITAGAFLALLGAVRKTEQAEQHTRDCRECSFDFRAGRESEPYCPAGAALAADAARARRDALQALGVFL